MSGRRTNGTIRRHPKPPDLRKATPEALARALLRPKKPADSSLRVSAKPT